MFLGAGASRFAGMPTTRDMVNNALRRVIRQEKWGDSSMAASLARNIVRNHADEDVEALYQTMRDMKAAEELHGKAMKRKVAGDNQPAWKREMLTTARSHPDNEAKKKTKSKTMAKTSFLVGSRGRTAPTAGVWTVSCSS